MPKRRSTAEQIVGKLREAEVELSKGTSTAQVRKKTGVSEQADYRWRRECGGLKMEPAKRLKLLERQTARLKRPVADQALDTRGRGDRVVGHVGHDRRPQRTTGGAQLPLVADSGPGLSPETRAQRFVPFLAPREQGQGIGLTRVQEILLAHGFDFALENRPAGGTEFTNVF